MKVWCCRVGLSSKWVAGPVKSVSSLLHEWILCTRSLALPTSCWVANVSLNLHASWWCCGRPATLSLSTVSCLCLGRPSDGGAAERDRRQASAYCVSCMASLQQTSAGSMPLRSTVTCRLWASMRRRGKNWLPSPLDDRAGGGVKEQSCTNCCSNHAKVCIAVSLPAGPV